MGSDYAEIIGNCYHHDFCIVGNHSSPQGVRQWTDYRAWTSEDAGSNPATLTLCIIKHNERRTMQYYCYDCNKVYAHGSETRIVGNGRETRHFCPKCGQRTRSCAALMRLRMTPLPLHEVCDRCRWRFRCWTGEW